MNPGRTPMTIAKVSEFTEIGERTIRRWITGRLLATYQTESGQRVVILQDVIALEKRMRNRSRARPRDLKRRAQLDRLDKRA